MMRLFELRLFEYQKADAVYIIQYTTTGKHLSKQQRTRQQGWSWRPCCHFRSRDWTKRNPGRRRMQVRRPRVSLRPIPASENRWAVLTSGPNDSIPITSRPKAERRTRRAECESPGRLRTHGADIHPLPSPDLIRRRQRGKDRFKPWCVPSAGAATGAGSEAPLPRRRNSSAWSSGTPCASCLSRP